jgi:hypothetical protein
MRALMVLILLPACLAGGKGSDLIQAIREAGLDPAECYRVRDLSFARDEAQIFLTDGYLIFGKPAGDARVAAVFSADVEGGDAHRRTEHGGALHRGDLCFRR